MSDFWNKPKASAPKPWEPPVPVQTEVVLDEAAVLEITGESPQDVFEEEEEDTANLMFDANLRLEQGRLYQMVLANDIFGDTDADPKAIRNVQREIRKFVRERMEVMLGIRHEQVAQAAPIVSSPFNDLEVTALKMIASKVTGGKTEETQSEAVPVPVQPKKDGITAINGNLRANSPAPSVSKPAVNTAQKVETKPQKLASKTPVKSPIKEEGSALNKPIEQMSQEELAAYNKAAEERSARKRAAMPTNMVPHPTPQQLEMMYTGMAANMAVKLVPSG